jgi:predicted HNH restriction endonuclease
VHHLIPYRTFNGDYLAANRLANLISVCRPCHWKREGFIF